MNELVRSSVESITNLLDKGCASLRQDCSKQVFGQRRFSENQIPESRRTNSLGLKLMYQSKGSNSSGLNTSFEDLNKSSNLPQFDIIQEEEAEEKRPKRRTQKENLQVTQESTKTMM